MKINDLLTEISKKKYNKKELSVDKLVDYLSKNCSEFLRNNSKTPLYRGTWSEYETGIVRIDTTTGTRRSENTWNYYTLLMDNSPHYINWPKRSKSLICTTDLATASNYGNVMALIPEDGAKIGIVPYEDIWHVPIDLPKFFDTTYGGPEGHSFETLLYFMHKLGFPDTSFEQMVKYTTTAKFKKRLKDYGLDEKINPDEFIPYFMEQMAPEKLGMQMETTVSFKASLYPKKECWVEGKCVLVDVSDGYLWQLIKKGLK